MGFDLSGIGSTLGGLFGGGGGGGGNGGGSSSSSSNPLSGVNNLLGTASNFLIPGAGGLVTGVLNGVTGLFGGGATPLAGGTFEGLHSRVLSPLDDTKTKLGDAKNFVRLAKKFNLTVEEVAVILAYDMATTGHDAQYVFEAYTHSEDAGGNLGDWMREFNNSGMGTIVPGNNGANSTFNLSKVPAIADYDGKAQRVTLTVSAPAPANTVQAQPMPTSLLASLPALVQQAIPQPTSAFVAAPAAVVQPVPQPTSAAFTGQDVKNVVVAAGQGAYDAAVKAAMNTQDGQHLTNTAAKSWVQDHATWLVGGLGLASVLGLGIALVKKR